LRPAALGDPLDSLPDRQLRKIRPVTPTPSRYSLPATVLALYRVSLKSIFNNDHLRAHQGSALADLYLHGKRLYAGVLEKGTRRRCGEDWNRLDGSRRATPWRVWKLLREELVVPSAVWCIGTWITGPLA